jgi:hypothetical protein
LRYRHRDTVYHISVRQSSAGDAGVRVSVDGVVQSEPTILLLDDRREHQAEVLLQAQILESALL